MEIDLRKLRFVNNGEYPEIRCRNCGEVKPMTEYYISRKSPTGRLLRCKDCYRQDVRARTDLKHFEFVTDEEYIDYQYKLKRDNTMRCRRKSTKERNKKWKKDNKEHIDKYNAQPENVDRRKQLSIKRKEDTNLYKRITNGEEVTEEEQDYWNINGKCITDKVDKIKKGSSSEERRIADREAYKRKKEEGINGND